jgi:hypothetical protein
MMTAFSLAQKGAVAPVSAQERLMRKPQRLCTTVSWQVAQRLQEWADYEGRSLSNLIAHLSEVASP